jgi:hypothetical protein
MYLVGARFSAARSAEAAVRELRDAIAVGPGDLSLQPLGSVRYERPASGLVVAGRFAPADVDAVVEILQRHRGEVVFRRPEWRQPRPPAPRSDRATARCQRVTALCR